MDNRRYHLKSVFDSLSYHKLSKNVSFSDEGMLKTLTMAALFLSVKNNRNDLIQIIYNNCLTKGD